MFELLLSRRYLFRGKVRHISFISIISCLGITLGVATVIISLGIVNGIDGGLLRRIMRFHPHIIVEAPKEDFLYAVKKDVANWPQVKSAGVTVQTQIFARLDKLIVPLVVEGIDFSDENVKNDFHRYIIKEYGREGVWVGKMFMRRLEGEKMLKFYPLDKKLRLRKKKIRGVFGVGLYDIDNRFVIGDIDWVKSLSPNYVSFLAIKIRNPFDAERVKEKIVELFPHTVIVSTWLDFNRSIFSALKLEKLAIFLILSLIILIASFNIFATLTIKVVDKTKDIGILKSLGFSSHQILLIFSLQGIILGIIGIVLGAGLGVGVSLFLKHYPVIRIPEEIFSTPYLPITLGPLDIFIAVSIGLTISCLSSFIPALRAARLKVSEALRYE